MNNPSRRPYLPQPISPPPRAVYLETEDNSGGEEAVSQDDSEFLSSSDGGPMGLGYFYPYESSGTTASSEDSNEYSKYLIPRSSTAPARPLTEMEEFRRTSEFLLLENCVML
jgi:hypothetical protein